MPFLELEILWGGLDSKQQAGLRFLLLQPKSRRKRPEKTIRWGEGGGLTVGVLRFCFVGSCLCIIRWYWGRLSRIMWESETCRCCYSFICRLGTQVLIYWRVCCLQSKNSTDTDRVVGEGRMKEKTRWLENQWLKKNRKNDRSLLLGKNKEELTGGPGCK